MVPPADLRYLAHAAPNIGGDSVTGKVVSFLQTIYDSVAETLPDTHDLDCDSIETSVQRTAAVDVSGHDPYADALAQEQPLEKLAGAVKKDRQLKSAKFDRGKLVEREERWLPPGASMRDYWEQMLDSEGVDTANQKDPSRVSFSQFWKAFRLQVMGQKVSG